MIPTYDESENVVPLLELTQAGRLGADLTVIVSSDGATVRRTGEKDEQYTSVSEAVRAL